GPFVLSVLRERDSGPRQLAEPVEPACPQPRPLVSRTVCRRRDRTGLGARNSSPGAAEPERLEDRGRRPRGATRSLQRAGPAPVEPQLVQLTSCPAVPALPAS